MSDLQHMIETREIEVRCWHCGWSEPRTMLWLTSKRHMSCPTCDSVIVLDTSQVRREMMRQRKQLAALHGQIADLLQPQGDLAQRPKRTARPQTLRPTLDLALAQRHPETQALATRTVRRLPRG